MAPQQRIIKLLTVALNSSVLNYILPYTIRHDHNQFDFFFFFTNLSIPTIDSGSKERLEQDLTMEEINNAIMSRQSGKASSPELFPTDFYKKFRDKLAPLLLSVYAEALENNILPPTLCHSSIILLLKKNKDPRDCSFSRPINLTNRDGKVFSKVIALRLEKILPHIISEDQTGFVQGRQSYFNLRRLFNINILNLAVHPQKR